MTLYKKRGRFSANPPMTKHASTSAQNNGGIKSSSVPKETVEWVPFQTVSGVVEDRSTRVTGVQRAMNDE